MFPRRLLARRPLLRPLGRLVPRLLAGAALLALLGTPLALAGPADVGVGALRTPVNRAGAVLRAEPRLSSDVLGNVAHGTRLMVEQVDGAWMRVTTKVGDATRTGWLRKSDTVEPFALTGEGRTVGSLGAAGGRGAVSAAARGFSEEIEQGMRVSRADLEAAYALVESVEAAKPSPDEVQAFTREGRLGFPGRTR